MTHVAKFFTALVSHRIAQVLPYAVLILVFVAAGLTGHDPWKADEAYVFGVVHHMLETGDWVVPTLAGEPFMEKPPLYYWTASAFAYLLTSWLPLHDGARLASGFYMLITCCAVGLTARRWWGEGRGRYAILALLACAGTLVQSHMMMPDIPLLTGFALFALGFTTVLSRPVSGGVLLGLGVGVGFLSKGILGPAVMLITALLLPLCFKEWRTQAYWRGLLIAAVVSLPCCVIWPVVLYARSPSLFMDWLWINNFGRFFGFSVPLLRTEHLPWFWTQTIPWFTFPGLPLALWSLWLKRKTALSEAPVQYALVSFSVLMLVLAISSSGRSVYAWPLLVPIAILAVPGILAVPKLIDRLWVWMSMGLFGLFSLAIWTGWVIMMINNAPPAWPHLLRLLPVDFVLRFDLLCALAAALITIGAVMAFRFLWNMPAKGLTAWVVGITMSWSLLMTLWSPWLDFAKSYRSVFTSMPIPEGADCIASIGLGEGERAMLLYVTGFSPVRREILPFSKCNTLLIQQEVAYGLPVMDSKVWAQTWHGSRPGVTNERFWLFQLK